jgi:histidyl-tRNA synthetase
VEVISLLWRFFSSLGLPGLTLELNSLGEVGDRPAYKAALVAFLTPRQDQLCENCRRRLATNPLRVLDCKVPTCRDATEGAPKLTDHLSPAAQDHFQEVRSGLDSLDVPYQLNPRLVRGLDYYTLTTFEVTSTHLGAQNAVGAGGRYDGLVETLGGPPTPAVGFAVGIERVALMLPDTSVPSPVKSVFIAAFGPQGSQAGLRLLDELRARGVPAETDYRAKTLKNLLKQADRLQVDYCVIVGDDEAAKGSAILRHMQTKEQQDIPLSGAAETLSERVQPR